MAKPIVVRLMNPMSFVDTKATTTAGYWRIRHDTIGRDTSLAIPVILAKRPQNRGYSVDFAMPWNQGHAGDYDSEELFAWMEQICRKQWAGLSLGPVLRLNSGARSIASPSDAGRLGF